MDTGDTDNCFNADDVNNAATAMDRNNDSTVAVDGTIPLAG
jgi:hypothetical protein